MSSKHSHFAFNTVHPYSILVQNCCYKHKAVGGPNLESWVTAGRNGTKACGMSKSLWLPMNSNRRRYKISSQYEIMKGDTPLEFIQATEQGSQQRKLPAPLVMSSISTPPVTETDQGKAVHQRGCNIELLHWSGEGRNGDISGMTATKKMALVKACMFPPAWWQQAWWDWCRSTEMCSRTAHRWTDRMRHAMAAVDRKKN